MRSPEKWSHVSQTDLGPLTCRPLTGALLSDMESVLGERGVARRCFCMHWRRPDGGFGDTRSNQERFADRAGRGRPPGLLGYVADSAVGWVQVGPRSEFPTIARSPLIRPIDDEETWSINCFVVRAGHRKRGVGAGLLDGAIAFARAEGARMVEAYPVDGGRSSSVDLFTGTLGMFDRYGFVELIRRNDSRPIVRLTL